MTFMLSAIVVWRLNCGEIPIEGSVMSSVDGRGDQVSVVAMPIYY